MVFVLLFIILLLGLTVVFSKAADWFEQSKGINIVPAALIDTVGGNHFYLSIYEF